jgi:UDP-3-O-[3-hydroxymyristoyl] glucosamine N-acyltransferase
MADPRFFRSAGPFSVEDIARVIGGDLAAPALAELRIADIAPLDGARDCDISVYFDTRYRSAFLATRAGAVVTTPELGRDFAQPGRLIFVAEPRLAYVQIGHLFYPDGVLQPLIDARATIAADAEIGEGARIEAGAVIGGGASIGKHCLIAHNAVIGGGVIIGEGSSVGPNSCVSHARIGRGVRIASCVTIGGEGFGFVPGPDGLMRMQQLGRVIIEDRVEIGANSAIDRGATGDTVIGAGTVIDNLVQIGHNVRLGRHCVISGQAGVAGSTVIGDRVMIGGQAAISDHLTIGAGARIAGKSGVMRDVDAGATVAGYPAVPVRQWHRQTASLATLGNGKQRV